MHVLIISPGHPALGGGGAERASYSLFRALKSSPDVSAVTYVARAEPSVIGHLAPFGCFRGRQNEILAQVPDVDGLSLQSVHPDSLRSLVRELVLSIRPDVVHVHHILRWGLELFDILASLGQKVVFTLHEYWIICNNDGQMVKTSGELCYAASPAECAACFPDVSPGKFFVRGNLIAQSLGQVSHFVSPSRFLARRASAWGLPGRISVIENVIDPDHTEAVIQRPLQGSMKRIRTVVGYFGQITPYKGVDVLLEACLLLHDGVRDRLDIRIYGENKHWQGTSFGQRLSKLLDAAPWVSRMGSFQNEAVISLMMDCDWVVVPSIWWENSPVVIQEAKVAGVGLIGSDIGGIAEKLTGLNDIVVPSRSPAALASALTQVSATRNRTGSVGRPAQDASLAEHLRLYHEMTSSGHRK